MNVDERINLTFLLCNEYDEKEKSMAGMLNEVLTENDAALLKFMIMVNGIGCKLQTYRYDFIIKCVDSLSESNGKASYLFTMEMSVKELDGLNEDETKGLKSELPGVISDIAFVTQALKFPSMGRYEIQVYKIGDNEPNDGKERMKNRGDVAPVAVYPILVTKKDK